MAKNSGNLSLYLISIIVGAIVFFILAAFPSAVPAKANDDGCFDTSTPVTPEEQRIEEGAPIPQQILSDSHFDHDVDEFMDELCTAESVDTAKDLVKDHGTQLWEKAVQQAQGKGFESDLDRYDDRPLYWARLHMTRAIRQWTPDFHVTKSDRADLLKELEYTSRGITAIDFPSDQNVKKILVSGFDPYQLQNEPRRSNPSGAIALQLDGLQVRTDDGPAVIQAVNFPVRWKDFEDGIVEDTFAPYLKRDAGQRIDLMMTISQGGPRQMAIEGYAGRWHTGVDNLMESRSGVTPPVDNWPMPDPLPEFIETTLPWDTMVNAETGPWPVFRNDTICELLPPDFSERVCHDNGPTPGAKARSGGGGAYLSNESQYRSNRVRIGVGAFDIPGGHLHVAAQEYYPEDPDIYITPEFKDHRKATVDQAVELVKAAANKGKATSSSEIESLVERMENAGKFDDESTADALKLHLTAVGHYENKDAAEKVVKHMKGFQLLLDHEKENQLISEREYRILRASAENVIEKWK